MPTRACVMVGETLHMPALGIGKNGCSERLPIRLIGETSEFDTPPTTRERRHRPVVGDSLRWSDHRNGKGMPTGRVTTNARRREFELGLAGDRIDMALISASTRPALAYCSDQCIGTKIEPRFCCAVTTTRATIRPWPLSTTARSFAATPATLASSGWISTNGSATWLIRRGALPVRVIVCHWSRTRPVLRTSG